MKSDKVLRWTLLVSVLAFCVLFRLLSQTPNFSPLGALALFSGFLLPGVGMLLPLGVLVLSDLFLGFYPGFGFVYLGFLLVFLLGTQVGKRIPTRYFGLASLSGSLCFFFVSNFGHWLMTNMYPKTTGGLISAYIAGLPFLRWSILGDLLFASVFFGAYFVLSRKLLAKSISNPQA